MPHWVRFVETPPLPTPGDPNPTLPAVYIERALVNPAGDDPGKEVVVIGNTTLVDVNLTGWSIVDKNNAAEALGGVLLPSGGSVPVVLSSSGARLSNKGGTIRLLNPSGVLITPSATRGGRRREPVRQVQYMTRSGAWLIEVGGALGARTRRRRQRA